jgi:hypothetical protein
LVFVLLLPLRAAADTVRETYACAAMSSDSAQGLSMSVSGAKAVSVDRTLRTQALFLEGGCLSYIEVAGTTTSPGGPVFATLYVLRSGAAEATVVSVVAVPEGKSGVFTSRFTPVCSGRGDAAYISVALNAGSGIPYETAACSYVAVGY